MRQHLIVVVWFGLCCLMTPHLSKDIRPQTKLAVSLGVTLIFLRDLLGYVRVSILTLSPPMDNLCEIRSPTYFNLELHKLAHNELLILVSKLNLPQLIYQSFKKKYWSTFTRLNTSTSFLHMVTVE